MRCVPHAANISIASMRCDFDGKDAERRKMYINFASTCTKLIGNGTTDRRTRFLSSTGEIVISYSGVVSILHRHILTSRWGWYTLHERRHIDTIYTGDGSNHIRHLNQLLSLFECVRPIPPLKKSWKKSLLHFVFLFLRANGTERDRDVVYTLVNMSLVSVSHTTSISFDSDDLLPMGF